MNFIQKNFQYAEMNFEDFVAQASEGRAEAENGTVASGDEADKRDDDTNSSSALAEGRANPSPSPNEWFYLRSLGTDPRKDVSDIAVGFPELAPDFVAPPFVPDGAFFSSVFRIASPGMQVSGLGIS